MIKQSLYLSNWMCRTLQEKCLQLYMINTGDTFIGSLVFLASAFNEDAYKQMSMKLLGKW